MHGPGMLTLLLHSKGDTTAASPVVLATLDP
jgi:hypothetical protein